MSFQKKKAAAVAVLCLLGATSLLANAQTIRIANQGDALSLDPHSLSSPRSTPDSRPLFCLFGYTLRKYRDRSEQAAC